MLLVGNLNWEGKLGVGLLGSFILVCSCFCPLFIYYSNYSLPFVTFLYIIMCFVTYFRSYSLCQLLIYKPERRWLSSWYVSSLQDFSPLLRLDVAE